jgi:hypothetical protein
MNTGTSNIEPPTSNAEARVHCAWCAHERGEREFPPGTSHGICPRHAAEFAAEMEALFPGRAGSETGAPVEVAA